MSEKKFVKRNTVREKRLSERKPIFEEQRGSREALNYYTSDAAESDFYDGHTPVKKNNKREATADWVPN